MSERKELAERLRETAADMECCEWSNEEVSRVRRAADLFDPPAQGRTVRVRACCAVDADGDWNICGWKGAKNEAAMRDIACDMVKDGERVTWIEASVPLPEETTVEGEVQP